VGVVAEEVAVVRGNQLHRLFESTPSRNSTSRAQTTTSRVREQSSDEREQCCIGLYSARAKLHELTARLGKHGMECDELKCCRRCSGGTPGTIVRTLKQIALLSHCSSVSCSTSTWVPRLREAKSGPTAKASDEAPAIPPGLSIAGVPFVLSPPFISYGQRSNGSYFTSAVFYLRCAWACSCQKKH